MPYGFIGNAAKNYLTSVSGALSKAHAVHSKDPHGGGGRGVPALPPRNNVNAQNSPESAMSGGYPLRVGNQSNIVVDEDIYIEIMQKIRITDSGIAEEIHSIATGIEEMCNTIYIVPATLPKYLAIVGNVKSSLGEFQSLAGQAGMKAHEFSGKIASIDGGAR